MPFVPFVANSYLTARNTVKTQYATSRISQSSVAKNPPKKTVIMNAFRNLSSGIVCIVVLLLE